jgi:hypothetical protein
MKKILIATLGAFQWVRRSWLNMRGISPDDVHDARITSGKAWAEFCDNLKAAGAALVYPGAPTDPAQQAEGVRYLSRLTRAALEAFVEYGDPAFPVFRRTVHETIKMGADNPDNHYLNAQISGEYEYIIRGKRNSIHYVGLFTQNGSYGTTGGLSPCGVLENIVVEDDGTFEVHLSRERKGKNWLKIEEDTSLLMVRQTYLDRENESPAEMHIEALNTTVIPGSINSRQVDTGLNMASLFVAGAPMLFSRWAKGFQQHTNRLPKFDPEVSNAAGGDANIIYYHSHWKLSPDEALVIRIKPPRCDTWNFQLNNYWMESLDYRYHRICINSHTAVYSEDGSVEVIVAHHDPGIPNWITTAGHVEGTMCWRWYRPEEDTPEEITCEVVPMSVLEE